MLLEIVRSETDPKTIVEHLNSINDAERSAGAVHSILRAMSSKVPGEVLRQFSVWHASKYDLNQRTKNPSPWLKEKDAKKVSGLSPSHLSKMALQGKIERRRNEDDRWVYKTADVMRFAKTSKEVESQGFELSSTMELISNLAEKKRPSSSTSAPSRVVRSYSEEDIDRSLAQKYLASSIGNRSILRAKVVQYAREMREGRWRLVDSIDFDWNGHLLNGHHRLLAVVESGKTIRFRVARGADPSNFEVTDRGVPRTIAHDLQSEGNVFGREIVLWFNLGARLLRNRNFAPTTHDIRVFQKQYADQIAWGTSMLGRRNIFAKTFVSTPLVIAYSIDPENVMTFARSMVDGTNLTEESPVLAARNYVLEAHSTRKDDRRTACIKIARCLMAYLDNEKLSPSRIYANESTVERIIEVQPKDSILMTVKPYEGYLKGSK